MRDMHGIDDLEEAVAGAAMDPVQLGRDRIEGRLVFTTLDDLAVTHAAAWHLRDIESNAADISQTSGFPAIIYKFDELFGQKGWYLRAPDDAFSYDWKADEFTQAPIGLGFGRAFVMGKQPVNVFASGWKNLANPDTAVTPKWALKARFSLVFPK